MPDSSMRLPKISTNLAISADGKISSVAGIASGWTSKADHARLLELRGSADALLVGRGTLESDRMTMTIPGENRQPLRCIVSRNGKIDPSHPIFGKPGGQIHLLITSAEKPDPDLAGITFHHQSLLEFIHTLATDYSVKHLHCEGGGQLIKELTELDLIDEFHLTIGGHTLFSGALAPTATGIPSEFFDAARAYQISRFEPQSSSGECFLTYTRLRK